MYHLAALS